MDKVDAQILRLLYWNPFNPVDEERGALGIWDIARTLGVHGNTIKRRLADMEEAGVLLGLSFFPNSTLLGVHVAFYSFTFPDQDACDRAAEVVFARGYPGITMRLDRPEIRLNMPAPVGENPDEAAAQLAASLGASGHRLIMRRYWDGEPLTDLEMRVLKELHKDLFAGAPDVAARVGVTPKTARKCIQSLRDKKTFCVVPLVDHMPVRGLQSCIMDVFIDNDHAAAAQVFRSFPDLLPNGVYTDSELNFIALVESPADLADMVREIRSIPGVTAVDTFVPLQCRWKALPAGLGNVTERLSKAYAVA